MSDISRITKAIVEVGGHTKFNDADEIRRKDVDIFLPKTIADADRRMAQTAVALLLRCFNKGVIRIHSPISDPVLRLMLEKEAAKMGTKDRLDFQPTSAGQWCLAIGFHQAETISVDVSGWTARINGSFETRISPAAPVITFAVACAVAKLFNWAVFENNIQAFEEWDFCLLRLLVGKHDPVPTNEHLDLGKIAILGAGALGSAVAYILSISDWSGQLDVIDYQLFEEPNLETCIFADIRDVNMPLRKALSIVNRLQGHKIVASERQCRVNAGDAILQEKRSVFVSAVDNPETRTILDTVNSDVLINAGIGGTKQDAGVVLWTEHGNGRQTLSSLYHTATAEEAESTAVPEEFRDKCSRADYRGVSLALPFAGLAGGSLLTASIYRKAIGSSREESFLQIDLLRKQQKITLQ